MKQKIFSLLLCLILTLTVISSTAFAVDPLPFQGEFPIVEEPITLTCFNWAYSYTRGEFKDQKIWQDLEEKTGIHIEFETYFSDVQEKLALKLATNDLPDFFYKVSLSNTNVYKYARDAVFTSISPYLETNAPHFLYQIENTPGMRETITMADGEIYGFPYLVTASPATTLPMFVNAEWLEQLGVDQVPNTLDGLKELLIRVRDEDINGNGDADDEIPLISTSFNSIVQMFLGSFGLGTRGTTAPNIDIDENGELRYYPAADEYKDLLLYLRELYQERLIYQEIFNSDIPIVTALGEQDLLFMGIFNIRDYIGETHKGEFDGIYEPFIGPTGESMYAIHSNPISQQNTFISTTNQYPAETIELIDYFYSNEGVREYFMGFEGETYEYDESGSCVYTDFVKNNPDGLGIEEVLGSYVPWAGGSNPSIAEDTYFGNNMYPALEQQITRSLLEYTPDEAWGLFNYDEADATRLSTLETDIDTYMTEMRAKFVTGNASLENEWDTYIETLNQIGLGELMEIYRRGLEAYEAASKD